MSQATLHSYQQLIEWHKPMKLAGKVHRLATQRPAGERFQLTSQIRRSAVGIPSKLAEGQACGGGTEFSQFLRVASEARQELETQSLLAIQFGYLS